ncbi:hypothetical protein MMC30_005003 [Trapelia coarctata]|nr:hypothetical protein [Trapelia coarctata]
MASQPGVPAVGVAPTSTTANSIVTGGPGGASNPQVPTSNAMAATATSSNAAIPQAPSQSSNTPVTTPAGPVTQAPASTLSTATNGTASAVMPVASTDGSTQSSSSTGLIAGVAVLGALLALALIALALLLVRSRRNKNTSRGFEGAYESKAAPDSSLVAANYETTINGLETQLQKKDAQLKESQAALLQHGRRAGVAGLDDKQIHQRFAGLAKSINDWAVTHFKTIHPGVVPSRDVEATVQAVFPNYSVLLQTSRTKYLVLRGLVAEVIFQAFATGELLGNPAFSELNQTIAMNSAAPTPEANEWRSLTMTLLEKTQGYRSDRASSVQEVSKKIEYMTSTLTGLDYSEARFQHLQQVVENAAGLAMDLAKERAVVKVEKPSATTFDATSMEDVLQDHKGEVLQGRPIQGVVFPAVIKAPEGEGAGGAYLIAKAQVLV